MVALALNNRGALRRFLKRRFMAQYIEGDDATHKEDDSHYATLFFRAFCNADDCRGSYS